MSSESGVIEEEEEGAGIQLKNFIKQLDEFETLLETAQKHVTWFEGKPKPLGERPELQDVLQWVIGLAQAFRENINHGDVLDTVREKPHCNEKHCITKDDTLRSIYDQSLNLCESSISAQETMKKLAEGYGTAEAEIKDPDNNDLEIIVKLRDEIRELRDKDFSASSMNRKMTRELQKCHLQLEEKEKQLLDTEIDLHRAQTKLEKVTERADEAELAVKEMTELPAEGICPTCGRAYANDGSEADDAVSTPGAQTEFRDALETLTGSDNNDELASDEASETSAERVSDAPSQDKKSDTTSADKNSDQAPSDKKSDTKSMGQTPDEASSDKAPDLNSANNEPDEGLSATNSGTESADKSPDDAISDEKSDTKPASNGPDDVASEKLSAEAPVDQTFSMELRGKRPHYATAEKTQTQAPTYKNPDESSTATSSAETSDAQKSDEPSVERISDRVSVKSEHSIRSDVKDYLKRASKESSVEPEDSISHQAARSQSSSNASQHQQTADNLLQELENNDGNSIDSGFIDESEPNIQELQDSSSGSTTDSGRDRRMSQSILGNPTSHGAKEPQPPVSHDAHEGSSSQKDANEKYDSSKSSSLASTESPTPPTGTEKARDSQTAEPEEKWPVVVQQKPTKTSEQGKSQNKHQDKPQGQSHVNSNGAQSNDKPPVANTPDDKVFEEQKQPTRFNKLRGVTIDFTKADIARNLVNSPWIPRLFFLLFVVSFWDVAQGGVAIRREREIWRAANGRTRVYMLSQAARNHWSGANPELMPTFKGMVLTVGEAGTLAILWIMKGMLTVCTMLLEIRAH